MSTIILARHGRPAWDFRTPIPGHVLGEWTRGVDGAPLDLSYPPPEALHRLATASDCVATSTLRRSLESARALAPGVVPVVDPVFREVPLPTANTATLRLPPRLWVFLARSRWYRGWSPGVESYAEALDRARAAATRLLALGAQHERILLIAHGIMNGLIARRLRREGWRGPWVRPRRYWAYAVWEGPHR